MYCKLAMVSLIAAGLWLAGPARAAEFSAQIVNRNQAGERHGAIYVKGPQVRRESPSGSGSLTIIMFQDKKLFWVLRPEQKTYLEMPLTDEMVRELGQFAKERAWKKLLGKEMVNGYETEKYETAVKTNGGETRHFMWISPKLGMPIKITNPDGSLVMEYQNIKEGGVSDSLFAAPPGYKKISLPAAMPIK
jgi:outer membrane lipoprotein-sorting protein